MTSPTLREIIDEYEDIYDILNTDIYTYCGEEGLIYDEAPFDDKYWMTGCSKICIIGDKFVFKTSFSGYAYDYNYDEAEYYDEPIFEKWNIDYCLIEYLLYQRAVQEGVDMFFAWTDRLNDKVYIQEKMNSSFADCNDNGCPYPKDESFSLHKFSDFLSQLGLFELRLQLGTQAMRYLVLQYKIDDLLKLQDFIIKYDINDLHENNFGWFGDKLKFFDFCGYKSNTLEKIKEL